MSVAYLEQQRTEFEVAGDVIVLLLERGLLKRDPVSVQRIADTTGVPVAVIREAWHRHGDHRLKPLRPRPVDTEPPALPASIRDLTPAAEAYRQRRKAAKEPVKGMRKCSYPDHEGERLIPRTEFSVKDPRTGSLRAWCKECMKVYVKKRYLSSKQMERLGSVLQFVLADGDEQVGSICPGCHQPCQAGQEVVVPTGDVHHSQCVHVAG